MANYAKLPDSIAAAEFGFSYFDDFLQKPDTTNGYIATLTDSGTATLANVTGGVLPLVPSDGTVADNDEAYLGLAVYPFAFAANKDIVFRARVQYTEANTDDANIAVGLTSSVAANLLVDDGGGLRASGTSLAIYKVDGETVWRCVSRVGSTVNVSVSTTTAGGSAYSVMAVEAHEITSTQATITFWVDGQPLRDSTNQPIRHVLAYSGASALTPFAAVKNGFTNLETLNVDYMACVQAR